MHHRSPRPVLDRLLPDVAPGMARRGILLVAAVVTAVALGVAVAGPLADPAPGERTLAVKSPFGSASASWSIGTPSPSVTEQRKPRASRGGERSTPPSQPAEPEPTPAPETQEPSRTADDRTSPSPGPSRSSEPSPTQRQSPSPEQDTTPDTSATTSEVDDDSWTVESDSTEGGDSFECSLDGAGYAPCDSTETFDDLDHGKHTLEVRAVDEDGDVDPSPAKLVTNVTGGLLD